MGSRPNRDPTATTARDPRLGGGHTGRPRVGAVHAVHEGLDQAGTATHAGYTDEMEPTFRATVYVNISHCGVEVGTTHDPFHLTDVQSAVEYTEQHD